MLHGQHLSLQHVEAKARQERDKNPRTQTRTVPATVRPTSEHLGTQKSGKSPPMGQETDN